MSGRTQITLFEGSDTHSGRHESEQGAAAAVSSSPAYSIVDLSAAYGPQNSSRVERGFAFSAAYRHLIIVDEFEFAPSSSVRNVTWSMHTMASIKLAPAGGGSAVLSLGGAVLHARVLEPRGAAFSAVGVNLHPPYNPSVGVSKLALALPITATAAVARIVVELSVSAEAAAVTPNPLAQWGKSGPFAGLL